MAGQQDADGDGGPDPSRELDLGQGAIGPDAGVQREEGDGDPEAGSKKDREKSEAFVHRQEAGYGTDDAEKGGGEEARREGGLPQVLGIRYPRRLGCKVNNEATAAADTEVAMCAMQQTPSIEVLGQKL